MGNRLVVEVGARDRSVEGETVGSEVLNRVGVADGDKVGVDDIGELFGEVEGREEGCSVKVEEEGHEEG